MAFSDTDSSRTWIDQELLETIILDGGEVAVHVAGIHGTSPIQSKKGEVTLADILWNFVDFLQQFE